MAILSFKRRLVDVLNATIDAFDIYRWLTAIARNLTIVKPGRSFGRAKVGCRRQKSRKGYKT